MEKINKIIFIKHMNLKLQYISIKLLIELAGKIIDTTKHIARRNRSSHPDSNTHQTLTNKSIE